MTTSYVQVEKQDSVAILRLEHPPANALSGEVFKNLSLALDKVEEDPQIKAVVLAGKGKFFAAGADIKEFTTVHTAEEGRKIAEVGQGVFARMEEFSKPILAAIHGAALGGGLELAMACHMRFATAQAKLGLPELNLGLIPGFAGTQRLPRLIGKAKALELLLSGQPISGEEALRLGLVNRIVVEGELETEAIQFASMNAEKSAVTLRYALAAVLEGERNGQEAGSRKEAELFGKVFESADAKEGITAFIEKRKPNFKDQ
ncbi:enoyl-CoA hydratase [Bacillus horti]|uniref:Enoyl-CoA hydratase n=1 Tax=Caldalkalibacillus horti TaxID=77523 RepID=A0ABT9VU12_9BACI|nr:enoyl-CoA hydratase [Bacillus horti]MDQ0164375.1 enoyl-CoA hydratase [Bacillus horti]